MVSWPAHAAPGEKFTPETKWSEKASSKRQVRANDIPVAPNGFEAVKIASNLGEIVALAVVENDVFIADAAQNRILRLKGGNANTEFVTRAEYLIGFDGLGDLATDDRHLFISDKNGIWKIDVSTSFVATKAPKLLLSHRSANPDHHISMAISPDNKHMAIGTGSDIYTVDLSTGKKRLTGNGNWNVRSLAVSPSGTIWAGVNAHGISYILPIRPQGQNVSKLALPRNANIKDLRFWDLEQLPENWPKDWSTTLFMSLDGSRPMLAQAHFNFGDISPNFSAFIDGFSMPSRFVGRREYWGAPSTIEILSNGQLIFAEAENGALWALEKLPEPPTKPEPVTENTDDNELDAEADKKSIFPEIIRGSSIQSASGLETDKLLKAPKQPDEPENE